MPVNKYQEFIPHTVLQDYVKRFWILEKEYTPEDSVEEVIPESYFYSCVIALHAAQSEDDLALIGKQSGSFPFLGLDTEDCIGEYQRMKALGVKFHGEPDVRPYGTGVMLEDLYGNRIFMNQEPEG